MAATASAPGAGRSTRVPWQAKFAVLALIWGSSFLLMKVGLRAMAPLQISGLRVFAGAAVLLLLLSRTSASLPRGRRVWAHLGVSAFLLAPLPFTLFAAGEERVSSALAGIGNGITPVTTLLFGLVLLPTVRLEARTVVAVVGGFLGVLVILQPWQSAGRPDLLGFGMTLLAGASYGAGWTWNRRFLAGADLGGLAMPTATLVVGAVQMVPILTLWWWLNRDEFAMPWSVRPDAAVDVGVLPLVAILALGVVGTGLAYALQFDVVRAAGATVMSTVTYVIPVVSVLLGVLLLDERLSWPQVVGAAVVVTSALVVGWPSRRSDTSATPSVHGAATQA